MGSTLGYLIVAVGSVLTFGGVLRLSTATGSTQRIWIAGTLILIGVVTIVVGATMVVSRTSDETTAHPEEAVEKTDSRFGDR